MNKLRKFSIFIPIVLCVLSFSMLSYLSFSINDNHNKQYSSFLQDITNNSISKVIINDESTLTVLLKNGDTYKTYNQ